MNLPPALVEHQEPLYYEEVDGLVSGEGVHDPLGGEAFGGGGEGGHRERRGSLRGASAGEV